MNIKRVSGIVTLILLIAGMLSGCSKTPDDVIVVGASAVPHALILEQTREPLEAMGYELDIRIYSDYVLPNTSLAKGELDANFFQHYPYLVSFNQEKHTDIVSAASIHFEPLGIYSEKINSLAEIEKGAVVIIPDDTTNAARALLLLEACGMITVRTEAGITATIEDIITNPLELEFRAMQAEEIINAIEEADFVCMNGNYALEGGLSTGDALALEESNSLSAITFANIVAVSGDKLKDPKILALIQVLQSDEVRSYIEDTFEGGVVPVF